MFTIIIPTYNRETQIKDAIQSVLGQSYDDWELIIVDDGSSDNTMKVVESFEDKRIQYIYQENAERSAARNNGIRHAKGEWICFLDSDDIYLSNHLKTFHKYISDNTPPPSFILTGSYLQKGDKLIQKPTFDPSSGENPAQYILRNTTVTPICVCIHKSCLDKHRFVELFKKSYWEDTHLWIRLALEYPFIQIHEFTSVLQEHGGRSVHSIVSLLRVNDHIGMINHLFFNYSSLLGSVLTEKDRINYVDRKYRMFLYTARQNRQFLVSLSIWIKAMKNKASGYLLSEFPKIFFNQFGIGINK